MKVVDQLRGGARAVTELPKRAGREIKSGAGDLRSVPAWVGRGAGSAGRAVGRTVTGLPSRASALVRGGTSEASASPPSQGAGDGAFERARDNPRLTIPIVGGGMLLFAWIGWAIYVTSAHGARAGLGVVLSWPVLLGALVLVSLPFIGIFLLIRRLQEGGGEKGAAENPAGEEDELDTQAEDPQDGDDSEGGPESDAGEEGEEDGGDAEEPSDEDTDPAAKAETSG